MGSTEEDSSFLATQRYAIVTGSNKGIGLEVCKQLASKGVIVVLTARDANKGIDAMKTLKDYYIFRPENLVFHQLDVLDPSSISCLVDFVKTKYGKLDSLVNNAGILGLSVDTDALEASKGSENSGYIKWGKVSTQPYDLGEECIQTNYYGAKRMTEAFMPLLSLSDSPRIVNVSSSSGKLEYVINEWARNILNDTKALNEERIDEVLEVFLKDMKEDSLETKSWPSFLSAYTLSKATMNAYTRLLAKKHPNVIVNSVCPGYAVVTGANKGIGFGICKLLASNGVTVVLTARDEKRGIDALEKFKGTDLCDRVLFHQLDVVDPASVASLAQFVKTQFGKLDILVNNAAIGGGVADEEALRATGSQIEWKKILTESHELAVQCVQTNYYGAKRMVEHFIPLLELSESPRIVNVSSSMGKLKGLKNEWAKGILSDVENLTEEKIDEVLDEYLNDFKEGTLEAKGWPALMSAYIMSKAAMSAYTRILAKKYTRICINCVCPGFVKTDLNYNRGILSVEDGAETPVKVALSPHGGPSGCFFDRNGVTSFE